jgi:hypothetical protein
MGHITEMIVHHVTWATNEEMKTKVTTEDEDEDEDDAIFHIINQVLGTVGLDVILAYLHENSIVVSTIALPSLATPRQMIDALHTAATNDIANKVREVLEVLEEDCETLAN